MAGVIAAVLKPGREGNPISCSIIVKIELSPQNTNSPTIQAAHLRVMWKLPKHGTRIACRVARLLTTGIPGRYPLNALACGSPRV